MGWDGGGSVSWPYDWTDDRDAGGATAIISATKFDVQWADAATAIEACLNRNGENAIAADISWGGNKITSLGAATLATDAIRARQVAENAVQYGGTTGGSSNAYTVTNAFISSVATGTRLLCIANHTNSGASTMNVNGGGATAMVRLDGSTALSSGEIVSGDVFEVVYDGTSWVVLYSSGITAGSQFTGGSVSIGESDATPGALTLYGGGTGEAGAIIDFYNNADDDGTVDYWRVTAEDGTGDYLISAAGSTDYFRITPAGNMVLNEAAGTLAVGASDSVPAVVTLYGGGTGEAGASIDFYNNADDDGTVNYWRVEAEDGTGYFAIKAGGSSEYFNIATDGAVNVPGGSLYVGIADTTIGNLYLHGQGAGQQEGGELNIFMSADYDGTYESWRIDVFEDDLRFGPTGATAAAFKGDTLSLEMQCGAYQLASDNEGTKSSGTYTPAPTGGNFKHLVNGGAFTLAAPSQVCTLVIEVLNNASAGTITFSGFTLQDGDTLTTTNTEKFLLYITKTNTYAYCNVKALQ